MQHTLNIARLAKSGAHCVGPNQNFGHVQAQSLLKIGYNSRLNCASNNLLGRRRISGAVSKDAIVVGCVKYCDAVGSIWQGMMDRFESRGVGLDFVLFNSYERQVPPWHTSTLPASMSFLLSPVLLT